VVSDLVNGYDSEILTVRLHSDSLCIALLIYVSDCITSNVQRIFKRESGMTWNRINAQTVGIIMLCGLLTVILLCFAHIYQYPWLIKFPFPKPEVPTMNTGILSGYAVYSIVKITQTHESNNVSDGTKHMTRYDNHVGRNGCLSINQTVKAWSRQAEKGVRITKHYYRKTIANRNTQSGERFDCLSVSW
jgi:hypothetical protein